MKTNSKIDATAQAEITNADLAIALAKRDIEVFPCWEKDSDARDPKTGKPLHTVKSPYTKHGFDDASCNLEKIHRWWSERPEALIGLVPGQEAVKALVLDLDVKGGKDGVMAFRKLLPNWENYPFSRTPSGGEHIWMAWPEGGHGNETGDLPKGIDVRCDNGYICLGTLPDGSRYEADDVIERLLGDDPWPKMPAAIADALRSARKPSNRASGRADYSKPYSESYKPVTLAAAMKAHERLRDWAGNKSGKDCGPSGQFASLAEVAINALLEVKGRALEELNPYDAGKNVWELVTAFLNEADSEVADLAAQHLERRGAYSIARLIEKSDPDRGPAGAVMETARRQLTAALGKSDRQVADKAKDTPDWKSDTEAAVKYWLRKLARSGLKETDPLEFEKQLEAIAMKALDASGGVLDLHKRALGKAKGSKLEAAYAAECKKLADERREKAETAQNKSGGPRFPHTDQYGEPRKDSLPNVEAWLVHGDNDIWFDEFADEVMCGKEKIEDALLQELRASMHDDGLFVSAAHVREGLGLVARANKVHPVKDYFNKVAKAWDGKRGRIDKLFIKYCHAPNNEHWRAVGRLFMTAIVMRIEHPGYKWDQIVALLSLEGFDKSEFWRTLAICDEWHLEGFQLGWSQKEVIENTPGILIAEYEEMAGHGLKEQSALKAAATRRKEKARKAYGHFAETRRRSFVIGATANDFEILRAKNGNRRFIPLWLEKAIDIASLETDLDQLYGEAVHAAKAHFEKHGADVKLPEAHWEFFRELQEEHRLKTPIEDQIARLMDGIDEGYLAVTELHQALETKINDRFAGPDIDHAMQLLGWKKTRVRMGDDHDPQRYFIKGTSENAQNRKVAYGMKGGSLRMYHVDYDGTRHGNVVDFEQNRRRR